MNPEGEVLIEINKISKSFGSLKAVNELSLSIKRGEALGLLGPNGAGKTTAISMIVGLLEPDFGEVRVDGGNPADSKCRREIGIAPQSLSLYEEMTALENLNFFGSLYGYQGSRLKSRVDWCLDFSGLADRAKDRVEKYSGGMKRRLNIAVALIQEPKIVLLDEPTVGVDPQSRNHIFDCIESLKKQGLTVIYTTHYMEEAQRLCDRVAIMDHGKLMALDTVPELIGSHGGSSQVTAELESIPSFELPGQLEKHMLRFESNKPMDEIVSLTQQGAKFLKFEVVQPNLESVFLNLTGRSLRD